MNANRRESSVDGKQIAASPAILARASGWWSFPTQRIAFKNVDELRDHAERCR
jgi:hypothetical protein